MEKCICNDAVSCNYNRRSSHSESQAGAKKEVFFFALDQREFLNLSSFESRGKNSSKGGSIIGDCEEERKGVRNLVAGKTSTISISYAPERLLYGLSYY